MQHEDNQMLNEYRCEDILNKEDSQRTDTEKIFLNDILIQTDLFKQLKKESDYQLQELMEKGEYAIPNSTNQYLLDIPQLLSRAAKNLRFHRVLKNNFVLHVGERADRFYFILSGQALVFQERDKSDIQKDVQLEKTLSQQIELLESNLKHFCGVLEASKKELAILNNKESSFAQSQYEINLLSSSTELSPYKIMLINKQLEIIKEISQKIEQTRSNISKSKSQIDDLLSIDQKQLLAACGTTKNQQLQKYFTQKQRVCNFSKVKSLSCFQQITDASVVSREILNIAVIPGIDSTYNDSRQDYLELMYMDLIVFTNIFSSALSRVNYPLTTMLPLLNETKYENLVKIAQFFNLREYSFGTRLYSKGKDILDYVYLVKKGSVQLSQELVNQEVKGEKQIDFQQDNINFHKQSTKNNHLIFKVVSEGQFFGFEEIIPGQQPGKRSFTAQTISSCLIYSIPVSVLTDNSIGEDLKQYLLGQNILKQTYLDKSAVKTNQITKVLEAQIEKLTQKSTTAEVLSKINLRRSNQILLTSHKVTNIIGKDIFTVNPAVEQKYVEEKDAVMEHQFQVQAENQQALKIQKTDGLNILPDQKRKIMCGIQAERAYSRSKDTCNRFISSGIKKRQQTLIFQTTKSNQVELQLVPVTVQGDSNKEKIISQQQTNNIYDQAEIKSIDGQKPQKIQKMILSIKKFDHLNQIQRNEIISRSNINDTNTPLPLKTSKEAQNILDNDRISNLLSSQQTSNEYQNSNQIPKQKRPMSQISFFAEQPSLMQISSGSNSPIKIINIGNFQDLFSQRKNTKLNTFCQQSTDRNENSPKKQIPTGIGSWKCLYEKQDQCEGISKWNNAQSSRNATPENSCVYVQQSYTKGGNKRSQSVQAMRQSPQSYSIQQQEQQQQCQLSSSISQHQIGEYSQPNSVQNDQVSVQPIKSRALSSYDLDNQYQQQQQFMPFLQNSALSIHLKSFRWATPQPRSRAKLQIDQIQTELETAAPTQKQNKVQQSNGKQKDSFVKLSQLFQPQQGLMRAISSKSSRSARQLFSQKDLQINEKNIQFSTQKTINSIGRHQENNSQSHNQMRFLTLQPNEIENNCQEYHPYQGRRIFPYHAILKK